MNVIDRAAVLQATAIAAASALVVGLVNIGVDEVKRLIAARHEAAAKRKDGES